MATPGAPHSTAGARFCCIVQGRAVGGERDGDRLNPYFPECSKLGECEGEKEEVGEPGYNTPPFPAVPLSVHSVTGVTGMQPFPGLPSMAAMPWARCNGNPALFLSKSELLSACGIERVHHEAGRLSLHSPTPNPQAITSQALPSHPLPHRIPALTAIAPTPLPLCTLQPSFLPPPLTGGTRTWVSLLQEASPDALTACDLTLQGTLGFFPLLP